MTSSFVFEGRTYTDRTSLALAFGENWEEAKKRLYRGQVRRWAETFDLDLANRLQDIEEQERDQNRGVFRMIYHLYPGAPFAYRGEVHASPEALGAALGRALASGDQTMLEKIAEALQKGLLVEWLHGRGLEDLARAVAELVTSGAWSDRALLFRLHFRLCPARPFVTGGCELGSPEDAALFLARDWERRAALAWDDGLLAWLAERGAAGAVNDWRNASRDYTDDPERGLAVFIALIWPPGMSDPAILEAYRSRVRARLDRVRRCLEDYIFLGEEARELERAGQELTEIPVKAGYGELMDLHRKAGNWLARWRRLREDTGWTRVSQALRRGEPGEGVLDPDEYARLVRSVESAVSRALQRVEALQRSLGELGGSLPRLGLVALRKAVSAVGTPEERLAVLERAQALVREEAQRQERLVASRPALPPDPPQVAAGCLSVLFTPLGFAVSGLVVLCCLNAGWGLAEFGGLAAGLVLVLVLMEVTTHGVHRSQRREHARAEMRLTACREALEDLGRLFPEGAPPSGREEG
ncbi:MAG: hypothetical protein K6U08_00620 [Firmicutes bacterium]|nr:hypothetical protein [Bacillota bacterium]